MKFEELELSDNTKEALKEAGYIEATEIQEKSIPYILKGRDVIGQSKTGTGKTASYSLPMIEKIDKSSKKVQALILCPTRELAMQVSGEIRKFTKYQRGIYSACVYGGQAIEKQFEPLKKGVQIVIGTPGRIMDHMRRKTLNLEDVNMCILDEADEMLNMGFEEDIETILKEVPIERQTVLFSATMNKRILGIAKKYLKNPQNVKIKSEELTVNSIEQLSISVKESMKDEALMRLIEMYTPKKAIVFCNTKRKVDLLIENLKNNNYKAEALHGDIKQAQRERIMKRLRNGEFQILVATDVVARGIDVDGVELVINYDVPQEEEYYVHRIGRTGRNGNNGKAFTFVVGKEKGKLKSIAKYANTKIMDGKIPTVTQINKIRNEKMINEIQEVINQNNFRNEEILSTLVENNDIKVVAEALLTMLISENKANNSEEKKYSPDKNGNVKLFFSIGKKDGIKIKDIVGSISANTAVNGGELGKINVLDKFSFVEVPFQFVEDVLQGMEGKLIKGKACNIEIANK